MKIKYNLIITVLIIGTAFGASAEKLLHRDRYLVLDSRIIEKTENAKLSVGTVKKHPSNPLFAEDKPWEVRFDNLYANILYDAEEKQYKCWYSPFIRDVTEKPPMDQWDQVKYRPRGREMGICYATSGDGLTWDKPELGLIEFDGSTANNLVLRGPHGAGMFLDTYEKDPKRRYKMFYKGGRMRVRFSPDGLLWSEDQKAVGLQVRGDTHNNAFWAPERNRFVGITRTFDGQRIVARTESDDFETWSEAVEVLRGEVQKQTYAMPVFRCADVYLGMVMILRKKDDRVHCELTWSPDSVTWHRIDEGTPLIPLAEKRGVYDWGCAYAAAYPIVLPNDEIRIYYGASNGRHTSWRDGFLCLATLRPDGWAGYEPVKRDRPAVITTREIRCDEWPVRVTADVEPNGFVKVSIVGQTGKQLSAARPVTATVTDGELKWNGESRSKLIRLRFVVSNAKLYSFSFGS